MYMRIALSGLKRSGKDTIGSYLIQNYGCKRFAFADEVKRLARELFPEEFVQNDKPVDLLQWLGNTMRQRNPDVWINKLSTMIQLINEPVSNIVVTDVRYPNEVQALKNLGFTIVKVQVPVEVSIERSKATEVNFTEELLLHESEQLAQSNEQYYDYIIENTGTLEELYSKVEEMVEVLKSEL